MEAVCIDGTVTPDYTEIWLFYLLLYDLLQQPWFLPIFQAYSFSFPINFYKPSNILPIDSFLKYLLRTQFIFLATQKPDRVTLVLSLCSNWVVSFMLHEAEPQVPQWSKCFMKETHQRQLAFSEWECTLTAEILINPETWFSHQCRQWELSIYLTCHMQNAWATSPCQRILCKDFQVWVMNQLQNCTCLSFDAACGYLRQPNGQAHALVLPSEICPWIRYMGWVFLAHPPYKMCSPPSYGRVMLPSSLQSLHMKCCLNS